MNRSSNIQARAIVKAHRDNARRHPGQQVGIGLKTAWVNHEETVLELVEQRHIFPFATQFATLSFAAIGNQHKGFTHCRGNSGSMAKEDLTDEQKQWIHEIANRKETIPEKVMMVGFIIAGFGLVVFVFELFHYLQSGVWSKWTMLSKAEKRLPTDIVTWLHTPESWLGLHSLVMNILVSDLSMVLLLAGMGIFWIGRRFDV